MVVSFTYYLHCMITIEVNELLVVIRTKKRKNDEGKVGGL